MAEHWELVEPIEGGDAVSAAEDDAYWPPLEDFRSSIREVIIKHVDESTRAHPETYPPV